MISERQFNDVLKQVNEAFKEVNLKVDRLQKKVNSYVDSDKEKASGSKKTRPKA